MVYYGSPSSTRQQGLVLLMFVVVPQLFWISRVRFLLISQSFAYMAACAACIHVSVSRMPSQTRQLRLTNNKVPLPDQMTYKVSYPVEARAQKGQLFSWFVGHFGIVDIVGFHVCGPDEPHGSTQRFLQDAEFWNVFGGVDCEPGKRSQQCIAMSSGGRSLLDLEEEGGIPSPCELLDTILHTIIGEYCSHFSASTLTLLIIDLGHCNLFHSGVLHHDISHGNVLRYTEPVEHPALEMWDLACLSQCVLMYSTGSRAHRMWICVKGSWLMAIVQSNGRKFPTYRLRNDRWVPESGSPSTQLATYAMLFSRALYHLCLYGSWRPGIKRIRSSTQPWTISSRFYGSFPGPLSMF